MEGKGSPLQPSGIKMEGITLGFKKMHTSRFLIWIKTLGVDTTAIDVSAVAPSSSCFAKAVDVSSLY